MADNRLQLGITITADGKAAEQALGKVQASLQQTKRAAKETSDAWARLSAVGSAKLASITAAQNLTKGMSAAGAAARQAAAEAERMRRGVGLLSSALDTSTTSLAGYAKGLAGLFVAYRSVRIAAQAMMAAVNAAAQLDRLKSGMIAASGGASAAASNLQFVEHTAKTLGINLLAAQEGFVGLTAAARGTALQGQATQEIFSAVARASAALGKSSEDTQGILNALGQMISKGTVQMEELRGQLGDRLPGAFQIAARAMGMSTAELDKFVTQGNLTATEFLPKFAKALDDAYSSARFDKINNNIERVDTAWTKFKANIVDTDSISKAIGHVASLLDGLNTLVSKSKAYGEAFNVIPSKSAVDLALTGGKTGLQPIATEDVTGGFKAIEKGAYDAMLSVTKLNDAQKAVAALVIDTAKAYKVDPAWALAVAQQESGFNQLAKSAAGAQGVMQLMPSTAKQLGVNIADVNDNIKGGVLYLKQQQEQFKSLKLASAAYNAGPGNVTKFGGVPPFKETQNYVQSVAALYQQWQQVLGTQGTVFADAKEQAGELKNAFEQLKTHQDGMVAAAENYAKVQVEKIKTSLAALEAERKATQDITTEQLASAQTYDDKQRLLAAAAQQQDQFNQQALALAQQELSAQQSVIEARKSALETELANADRYNLTIIEQAKLKQAIASADSDLAVLAQQRAQAEIAAGQQVNEASQQALALKQQEQNAIGGVIAEYERQAEILNRLTQAQQAGASADQLKRLGQYYQSEQKLPELVSQEQLKRLGQYQLSTIAIRDAIDEMTKSTDDVREAQLRMNAIWDQTIKRIEQSASAWNELTNGQSRGIDRMLVGLAKYGESVDQINQKYEELAKHGQDTDPLGQTRFSELATQTANAFAESALGMRSMFQQGTDGYKALTAAAMAFKAVEDLVNISRGVGAVLNQLENGDPYTASIRAAIVAAQVASMGVHIAGGLSAMGSGSANRAAEQQARTGTGTVLGDSSAQSLSISKSIELIASNTSSDLSYSAKMLQALQNIESALSGASSLIFQSVLPSIRSDIANSGLDFGMKKISLFSGFDKEVTDYGLGQVAAQSLRSILQEGFKTLAKYADITDSFKVLGMELSSSTKTYIRDLDAGVSNQFNRAVKGMVDALKEGSTAFGLSSDDFSARLAKFKVDIGKISLKDLSSEEAKKQIESAFSKVFDEMASTLAVGLRPFKQGGEGAAETYFRVAEGIQRATGELEQIGIQAINYRDILEKQGDVYTEIVRQSVTAQGRLVAGTQEMVAEFNAAQGDIKAFYLSLVKAQDLLAAGFNVQDLDRTLINAAGGLDDFISSMQSFNDSYLSQADNIAGQLAGLSAQFVQLGVAMPGSKDAFLALMQSIDTTTESGKTLFGALLQLADGFGKVQDTIQSIRDKYADILNPFGKIGAQLTSVGDDFGTLIADAASKSQSAIDAFRKTRDDQVDAFTKQLSDTADMRDTLTTARNKAIADRDAAQKIIDEEMAKAPKKRNTKALNQARSEFNRADEAVRALTGFIESSNKEIAGFMAAIEKANADFNAASGAEQARLAIERGKILSDAQQVMFSTVSDIIDGLAQTIQEAQQRLDNVLSFQNGLATQIAQLQGSQATADLANARYGQANTAVNDYIGAVTSGGRARDTDEELRLLGNLQTAVMDRYNAEMALIQEGIQVQTNALNEALQVEIDNINAAAQAQVDAVNATLEAQIDAINAASEAQIKAQQKADAEVLKGIQKQNDLAVKAAQKANDAIIKAQQKVYDDQIKALQKQQDAEVKALQKQQDAALQVWNDQLDAANTLRDAIKGIQEYAKSLLLGPQSTLSPEARLAEAQRQYQELVAKASGGDADALSKLSGSTDAYLEAAKQYYGSGSQYQSIFDGVKTAMEGLGAMSAPDPDSIQSHIDALREAQEAQLEALRESQADAVDALREQQGEQLDALREKLNDQIDLMREQQSEALDVIREAQADAIEAMRESAQDQIESARKAAQDQIDAINKAAQDQIKEAQTRTAQAIADLSDPNKNAAMKALKDETIKKLQDISDLSEKTRAEAERKAEEARRLAAQQAAEAIRIARDQLAKLDSGLDFSAAQIRALNGLMSGLNIGYQEPVPQKPVTSLAGGSGLEGVAAYASGGYAKPGWALVGEQGPEIVRFERPAQVLNATQTRQALTGDDSKTYQALEAIKAELRAIVTTQSGANPQIIERLASIEGRLSAMEREQKVVNSGPRRRAPA